VNSGIGLAMRCDVGPRSTWISVVLVAAGTTGGCAEGAVPTGTKWCGHSPGPLRIKFPFVSNSKYKSPSMDMTLIHFERTW
jgi:hypothetical protein